MPTDKQRLSWLQDNPWVLEDCVDISRQGKGADDPIGFSFHETSPVYESIRQAIDAAMRSAKPKPAQSGKKEV